MRCVMLQPVELNHASLDSGYCVDIDEAWLFSSSKE